jgi:hypothetical protein
MNVSKGLEYVYVELEIVELILVVQTIGVLAIHRFTDSANAPVYYFVYL